MATFNDASPPIQLIPSPQVSMLDFFFPGFTGISAATEQLLAVKSNSYARVRITHGETLFRANSPVIFAESIMPLKMIGSDKDVSSRGGHGTCPPPCIMHP
ncbi:hypothetical protein K469DRAFT_688528 [Zopfia rhizophila CBS 207.26]|uniref:Uncharacterized protein n=1 Tax=Zopfia rhizophila CBS 207.26 TaxID=1314779 RepID=A0A6A6DXW4_9PEZI|nr:hypothetical protein K469DRAFT_688528 [Zopfia rhizophila CBS 207.26]